jgi:hypothetical protein
MRCAAIHPPRTAPWRSIASIAYVEQDGSKRHHPRVAHASRRW